MASSNVKYYEKQKELQDTITNCEQQRMNLERQFHIALQADQTSAKMKASRLHTYWKKICEDERRAKQRNEILIREFERIDAHMSEMNARTQRLALMKKQYEDYISRTYPDWNELMYGSTHQQQPSRDQAQKETKSSSEHPVQSQSHKQQKSETPPPDEDSVPREARFAAPDLNSIPQHKQEEQQQEQWQEQQRQQQWQEQQRQQQQWQEQQRQQQQFQEQQRQQQQLQEQQRQQQQQNNQQQQKAQEAKMSSRQNEIPETHYPGDGYGTGIYANLPSARSEHTSLANGEKLDPYADKHTAEEDEDMSQPIRSVEISSKSLGRTVQSTNNAVQPREEEDEEEEETSEFGTDSELPMGQSLGNTQIRVDTQGNVEKDISKSKMAGSIKPELSVDGLRYLLHLVEADIADSFSQEGYYRSSWPDNASKNSIIRKANDEENLSRVDVNMISMVILEQITLIVRNLAEKCVLPESLLKEDVSSLSAAKLRQYLSPEAQIIWDALYSHFIKLVKGQVIEPHELSAIFTPSLVAEGGSQDKGHMFVVSLLEDMKTTVNEYSAMPKWNKSLSPAQTMEGSGSFVEDGKVPRLKFGSLLDKPLSDDESSYINSSLPRDPVPLNETAAYKSMVSGSAVVQRRPSSAQEDTDDDVEKQIASALVKKPVISSQPSPRKKVGEMDEPSETSSQTLQTSPHVYVPTAMEPRGPMSNQPASGPPRFQGVKISSDLDTDTEVDAGIFGSSRQPENNYDFDFYD